MTWNTQDMNLSWYVTKANVDHTISGQGTAISILDHSATIPKVSIMVWIADVTTQACQVLHNQTIYSKTPE